MRMGIVNDGTRFVANPLACWAGIGALYFLLSLGCFLMLHIILGYADFRGDVQFLLRKQAYVHDPLWRGAFYVHVFSAIVALLAGFTQFSGDLLRRHRRLHRLLGHLYVWDILAVNIPAGMVLAVNANGHWPGKTAFVLLDGLWFIFTLLALLHAFRHNFKSHRHFMMRSYALTLSALTLRTWKVILVTAFTLDPVTLYILEAWLGFVPNLVLVEILIHQGKFWRLTPPEEQCRKARQ